MNINRFRFKEQCTSVFIVYRSWVIEEHKYHDYSHNSPHTYWIKITKTHFQKFLHIETLKSYTTISV